MRSVDEILYQHAAQISASRDISSRARRNLYRLFCQEMRPSAETSILDIGVSDSEGPEVNMLEKMHPWPSSITCAGLGDGAQVEKDYGVKYVRIEAGKPLPFPDKAFDIIYSNAVLEHVGGKAQRRAFISEALRVGKSLYLTVPNRWFPVEHHTAIPLLHWCPPLFRALLKGTRFGYWCDPQNLEFLSARQLRAEWQWGQALETRLAGLALGPFSSNIVMVSRGRG